MTTFTRAPHSTVLTDERGYTLDSTTPIPVDPAESGAITFTPSQVTVSSSSATQLIGANAARRSVLITNNDASINIFIGGASVTVTTGHLLKAGLSMTLPYVGAVYAKAASGSPVASVSEVTD
jgi:hypothetical protein